MEIQIKNATVYRKESDKSMVVDLENVQLHYCAEWVDPNQNIIPPELVIYGDFYIAGKRIIVMSCHRFDVALDADFYPNVKFELLAGEKIPLALRKDGPLPNPE